MHASYEEPHEPYGMHLPTRLKSEATESRNSGIDDDDVSVSDSDSDSDSDSEDETLLMKEDTATAPSSVVRLLSKGVHYTISRADDWLDAASHPPGEKATSSPLNSEALGDSYSSKVTDEAISAMEDMILKRMKERRDMSDKSGGSEDRHSNLPGDSSSKLRERPRIRSKAQLQAHLNALPGYRIYQQSAGRPPIDPAALYRLRKEIYWANEEYKRYLSFPEFRELRAQDRG